MTAITFAIDGDQHGFEFEPVHGDPHQLFTEGQDRIIEEVEELGYEFQKGAEPEYQEMTKAYRETPEGLAFGDITDRVEAVEPEPDVDDVENGVALELVGPDGETAEKVFKAGQNLGAVAAAIGEEHKVGLDERVVMFPSSERSEELTTDTKVGDVDGTRLHWDVSGLEED